MSKSTICVSIVVVLGMVVSAGAQDKAALAKAAQNPMAKMINLPFQNNTSFGATEHDVVNTLNIQPVWPVSLSEDWNMITRTVLPVVYNSAFAGGSQVPGGVDAVREKSGLGDTMFTAFLTPAAAKDLIWGAGPVALIPTSTDRALGAGEWGAGASVAALTMPGNFVIGGLLNNVWSFDGSVNAFLVQPFVTYNMPDGWYLTTSPMITANWEADSDNRWVVPLGGGIGKLMNWGKQPVNMQLHGYDNVEKPEGGPDWTLRLQIQFMFPG